MNTASNVFLLTAAAAIVGWGASVLETDFLHGIIAVGVGIVVYIVYEKIP